MKYLIEEVQCSIESVTEVSYCYTHWVDWYFVHSVCHLQHSWQYFEIPIVNQMFLFQLTIVALTFNNAVMFISTSGLASMQQEFSLQTITLYPQGGLLAGCKRTVRFQFMYYFYNL